MSEKTTQSGVLKQQLENAGWRFLDIEPDPPEWWAAEIWRLQSTWGTNGPELWITLLVDPETTSAQRKQDHVWAAGAAPSRPDSLVAASATVDLSLGRGWREGVHAFIREIEIIRRTVDPSS